MSLLLFTSDLLGFYWVLAVVLNLESPSENLGEPLEVTLVVEGSHLCFFQLQGIEDSELLQLLQVSPLVGIKPLFKPLLLLASVLKTSPELRVLELRIFEVKLVQDVGLNGISQLLLL